MNRIGPDQMNRAGLHRGRWPGRLDGLREACQPVAADDEHVAHAPVAQLGADPGPELGALGGLHPDAQHVLDPVQVDPDRDVSGLVADLVAVADPDHDRVHVDDRVDLVQGPVLPGLDLFEHRVGDVRDRLVRQFGPDRASQVVLDVPDRHPARRQRDDDVVQAAQPAGAFRDQTRLERADPVPRNIQADIPDLGRHRLRGRAVPGIRGPSPGRIALLVSQVRGLLRRQAPLEHGLNHLRDEPAVAGQLQPAGIDP
jgi:hypothetical protein